MGTTRRILGKRVMTCIAGAASTVALACAMGAVAPMVQADEAQTDPSAIDMSSTQWKDAYPDEYNSWWLSIRPGTNGEQPGYTWEEKMGKPVAMEAGMKSGLQIGAGCVSCHDTAFVEMLGEYGGEVVNLSEDELMIAGSTSEGGITCYSCHGDTPGEMVVVKDYIAEAIEAGGIETAAGNLVCAQCHALPNRAWTDELGSTAEDRSGGVMGSSDTADWSTLSAGTNADDVYQWFLDHGVKDPKIIIGEMEFQQYYGSTMEKIGVTCADCHMEDVATEDGQEYTRHAWQGANVNPAIYENCVDCHGGTGEDMMTHVAEIQLAYQERLAEVTDALNGAQAAIETSSADEETIAAATDLWFEARFHSRYGQDSSEGVHGIGNPNTDYCFDKCVELCDQIVAMVA